MRYLGIVNINDVVSKRVSALSGDTFVCETIDRKGAVAYAYEPGCRVGQGHWNDFRLLCTGLVSRCVAAAESVVGRGR